MGEVHFYHRCIPISSDCKPFEKYISIPAIIFSYIVLFEKVCVEEDIRNYVTYDTKYIVNTKLSYLRISTMIRDPSHSPNSLDLMSIIRYFPDFQLVGSGNISLLGYMSKELNPLSH